MSSPNSNGNSGGLTTPILIADNVQIVGGVSSSPDGLASLTKAGASDAAIALEVQSTTGGVVVPRMTLQQRNAQTGFWLDGTVVYITLNNVTPVNEFQFFEGGVWIPLASGAGSGNVVGPAVAGQNNIAIFDGGTGMSIIDSGVNISQVPAAVGINSSLATVTQMTDLQIIEFSSLAPNPTFGLGDCAIGISDWSTGIRLATIFKTDNDHGCLVMSTDLPPATPNVSTIFSIDSTDQTFLNARMTNAQILLLDAVDGMQVYQTDSVTNFPQGFYVYDSGAWVTFDTGGAPGSFPFRESGSAPNISLYMGTGFNTGATGARNLGISENSLSSLVSGTDNVSVGASSFRFLNNSSGNTAVGSLVYGNTLNTSATNSVFIGGQTGGNLSNVTSVNLGVLIGGCSMNSGLPSSIVSSTMIGNVSSLSSALHNCIYIGSSSSGDINFNAVSSNRVVIGSATACNVDDAMVIGGLKGSATYLKVGIGTQNPVAALHVNGSQALGFTRFISSSLDGVITSNYSVLGQWDYCIPVDTTGGAVTITLPATAGFGQTFIIKDVGGAANTNFVNINPNGRTIDGNSGTLSMTIPYASLTIYSNGTNYFSISGTYVPLPSLTLNEVSPLSYPYNAQLSDNVVFVDASSARTINLPDATTTQGKLFFVKDSTGQSQTNNITVQAIGGANIDGSSTYLVDTTYGATAFISDGTQYFSLSTDNTGGGGSGFITGIDTQGGADDNLFVGIGAGNLSVTGNRNKSMGKGTLVSLTTGNDNIAIGENVLNSNTIGNQCIGIGSFALANNTTSADLIAIGYQALESNTTGTLNLAIGSSALSNNSSGAINLAIGINALSQNTVGNFNLAIGASALSQNIADYNFGIGLNALSFNTSGSENLAIGTNSLNVNTTGSGNTGIGLNSLSSNTTGTNNFAAGSGSLLNNTTGFSNLAFGNFSLQSNLTGQDNVAIGYNALSSADNSYNVAIGSNAMQASTGQQNIAIGRNSLNFNTGSFNIAIGINSLPSANSASSNIAIGRSALGANSSDNLIAIGDQALALNTAGTGNVAIGTLSLGQNLFGSNNLGIGSSSLGANTTGSNNFALGTSALGTNDVGNRNIAIGTSSLAQSVSGNNNLAIGFSTLFSLIDGSNNMAIGSNCLELLSTSGNSSDNLGFGNNSLSSIVTGSFNIGFGSNCLNALTSGSNNLGIGYHSLNSLNVGDFNLAIGSEALQNCSASYNLAVGALSMGSITSGNQNVCLGYNTLGSNLIGSYNTAIGFSTLYQTTTDRNTGIGFNVLSSQTSGFSNTAVGFQALQGVSTGSRNIGIGLNAGITNVTGDDNIFIGYTADATVAGLTNAIAIGSGATVAISNALILGNGCKVGIGTNSPRTAIQVVGGITFQSITVPLSNPYNVASDDYRILVDTSTTAFTINLRNAALNPPGQEFVIKDMSGNAATNNITITTSGGTIDGAVSIVLSGNYDSLVVFSDGTNYFIQ